MKVKYWLGTDDFKEIKYFNGRGQLHNDKGPASVEYCCNDKKSIEQFFINGKPHNDKGPAVVSYHENGEKLRESFYLNGQLLTKEQWEQKCRKS